MCLYTTLAKDLAIDINKYWIYSFNLFCLFSYKSIIKTQKSKQKLCTNVLSHSSKTIPNSKRLEKTTCSIIRDGINLWNIHIVEWKTTNIIGCFLKYLMTGLNLDSCSFHLILCPEPFSKLLNSPKNPICRI